MLNAAEGRSPKELESRRGGKKEELRRCQEMGWRKKSKKGHKGERKQKCRLNTKKGCGRKNELKGRGGKKRKKEIEKVYPGLERWLSGHTEWR